MVQSPPSEPAELHEDSTIPPRRSGSISQSGMFLPVVDEQTQKEIAAGQRFGDYVLLNEIARGGMGVVYRARQIGLNRLVALKMILDSQLATEDDVRRFYSEAQTAASFNHPRIVQVYDVGCVDEQHYFSMEFIDGQSLSALVSRGPIDPRRAAQIMFAVCDAVGAAHARHLVHRDLKPANILLDSEGDPHVTDFGLAWRKDRVDPSEEGEMLGTASYMPPEQAVGDLAHIGPHTDVYALGATLYCLLTGRPPFQAATPADTLLQAIHQEPVPARQLNAQIPADLETICVKCLQKTVAYRYPDGQALAEDLHRFLKNEPILARPVSKWIEFRKWTQRNPSLALVAGTLTFAVVALFASSLMYNARLKDEREAALASEQRAMDLIRLSESLQSELGQRQHAAAESGLTRAQQLSRLIVAASRLPLASELAVRAKSLAEFDTEAEWLSLNAAPALQRQVAEISRLCAEWKSGTCPPELSDAVRDLTKSCREDWQSTIRDDATVRFTVERQAEARLAQTIELILASPSRQDAQTHLDRLLTAHRAMFDVLGNDQVLQTLDKLSPLLHNSSSELLNHEVRTLLLSLQQSALDTK